MEKVVIVKGKYPLDNFDLNEINTYLANGWSVKSVTPQTENDHTTIIFVIETKSNHSDNNTY